ncbi:MAG: ATP-binding protein, partial [Candidatus Woesearchaeota archaeon]
FISGSSKPEIAIQSLQYLVGRVSLIEMQPLSFKEFVSFKSPEKKILLEKKRTMNDLSQLQSEFQEFLLFGGYPDVVKEPNFEEKKKILQDILQVYLLKEIKDIMGYKNSHEFEKLLKTIATQNGRLHKHSTLSNTLGISWVKAQEYIHILTKTELVNTVQPFYTNKSKELIKTPKVYFNDIGLLNALLNNFSPLQERIDKGELLETFISQELSKRGYKAKFWSRQLSEVDFILEKDAKLIAIECKSHTAKLPLSLKTFMQEYTVSKAIVFNLKEDKVHTQIQTPTESTHYCNVSSILFF